MDFNELIDRLNRWQQMRHDEDLRVWASTLSPVQRSVLDAIYRGMQAGIETRLSLASIKAAVDAVGINEMDNPPAVVATIREPMRQALNFAGFAEEIRAAARRLPPQQQTAGPLAGSSAPSRKRARPN